MDSNAYGERLYPLVATQHPSLAPKIVGMLLEAHTKEDLDTYLQDSDALSARVDDCVDSIRNHQRNLQTAARNRPSTSREDVSPTFAQTTVRIHEELERDASKIQMLGEQLYPRVQAHVTALLATSYSWKDEPLTRLFGKVTGMLLEMDTAEVESLLLDDVKNNFATVILSTTDSTTTTPSTTAQDTTPDSLLKRKVDEAMEVLAVHGQFNLSVKLRVGSDDDGCHDDAMAEAAAAAA